MNRRAEIEAIIFASPNPINSKAICRLFDDCDDVEQIEQLCQQLVDFYQQHAGGFCLVKLDNGYQFQTVSEVAPLLKKLSKNSNRPLSRAALETLAIVAYREPLTRGDIEYMRGVESGNLIRTLLERELLTCVGRRDTAGKPLLFATGKEFFRAFSLGDLQELPPLESFQIDQETEQRAEEKISANSSVNIDKVLDDDS